VTQRDTLEEPWGEPVNLGPTINGPYGEFCTTFSPDGHWMVFVKQPAGGSRGCGGQDLWISHRKEQARRLGVGDAEEPGLQVNSNVLENGPALFEDEATGKLLLYYSSNRPCRARGPGHLRRRSRG